MPITIRWDNPEKTLLLTSFISPWRWQEFFDTLAVIEDEHRTLSHSVIWLHDHTNTHSFPLGSFIHLHRIVHQLYPNAYRTILIVGATQPLQFVAEALLKSLSLSFGVDSIFLATLEEGRQKASELIS
jgi:hypothetical protein